MLTILFKQPINFWRTLEIRYKLELITLLVIVFTVFGSKLNIIFTGWLEDGATYKGLTLLLSNFYSLLISISSLAIITWLIPHQKGLRNLLDQPLNSKNTLKLLFFYTLKYLFLYIVLLIPVLAALLLSLDFWNALAMLFLITVISLFFLSVLFYLRNQSKSNAYFLITGLSVITLYFALFSLFYWFTAYAIHFQVFSTFLFIIVTIKIYFGKKIHISPDNFIVFLAKRYHLKSLKKSDTNLPKIFTQTVQALFEKEYFSLWRNVKYKRLKVYTISLYILILAVVIINNPEYLEIWITAISCFFIWLHFSSRFNKKYSFAEPDWFIRTMPIKFRHLFSAKYFNELPILITFILIAFLSISFNTFSLESLISSMLLILIFSHLVLFSMLNFQIMFFDNARMAEYAFHFSVLFFVIMILNYPLVGPILALSLMLFFFYKNVKFLNK